MNNLVVVRSPAPTKLDPATHAECLEFVRVAIASNDQQTAHHIAAVLKDCYQNGYLDRAALWGDLTPTEQQQFQELLAPPSITREFARRIREALGYNSPAVATAIKRDLERAIDAGNVAAADVLAVVGAVELAEFDRLVGQTRDR
ncbi:hypothetical protein [Microcoleus sp. MON2_D5]|uniref:hypothetical protein n=1 Tax=Microcoleus sp. MON2_D5 TaxID=2818833 RepID=UPI002FD559B4